jgi:hypothetical protein
MYWANLTGTLQVGEHAIVRAAVAPALLAGPPLLSLPVPSRRCLQAPPVIRNWATTQLLAAAAFSRGADRGGSQQSKRG